MSNCKVKKNIYKSFDGAKFNKNTFLGKYLVG
jgi:hypothetical protein